MVSEELEKIVAAEAGLTTEEATRTIQEVISRDNSLRGLIVIYTPVGTMSVRATRSYLERVRHDLHHPQDGSESLLSRLERVGYATLILPMKPDGTPQSINPRVEQIKL